MRINKDSSAQCCECGSSRSKSLEMFDICIGGNILTICDLCNDIIFQKSLKATCIVNGKVKSKRDMEIVRKRKEGI